MGAKARSGLLWFTGLNLFQDLLQFATMLVLVRLLQPQTYGEFALVTSVLGFFTVFSFRSFLEHAFQVRAPEEPDYQTHFAAGGLIQLTVLLAMNAVALGMRRIPAYAPVAPAVHWISIYFLLDWGSELRVNMLERRMEWGRLRLLQATGLALSAVTSVGLALAGAGVYALVLPQLWRFAPPLWDLLVTEGWRPTFQIDRAKYRRTWIYGWTRIGSGLAVRLQLLIEGTVMVGIVGFSSYGIYGRATGLAAMACLKLASLLTAALFPVLTRFTPATERYRQASGLVVRAVAWSAAPLAVILGVLAVPVIRLLYGPKWLAVAEILPLALAVAALGALSQSASMLLLASKEQKKCLYADLTMLSGSVLAIALALPHGTTAYLGAMAAVNTVTLSQLLYWLWSAGNLSAEGIRQALVPPLLIALLPAIVFTRMDFAMLTATVPRALGTGLAMGVVYLLALRLGAAGPLKELMGQMPGAAGFRRMFRFQ